MASAESFGDLVGRRRARRGVDHRAGVEKRRKRVHHRPRSCSRVALGELGIDPVPIMRGEKDMRRPDGIVGSITHTNGYRAAIVATDSRGPFAGIDAEPHEPIVIGVPRPHQHRRRTRRPGLPARGSALGRLLFCAKETTTKAWFPLTRRAAGFEDAHITFEQSGELDGGGAHGTFSSRILIDPAAADGGPRCSSCPDGG